MPKYVLQHEVQDRPVTVFLERTKMNAIEVKAVVRNGSPWVLFSIGEDGKITSYGSLPESLGFDIDSNGYPVVVKFAERYK